MPRITRKEVDLLVSAFNARLRDGLHVAVQGRNGMYGVDLYDAHGMIRTFRLGTLRECYDWLRAADQALGIVNR